MDTTKSDIVFAKVLCIKLYVTMQIHIACCFESRQYQFYDTWRNNIERLVVWRYYL